MIRRPPRSPLFPYTPLSRSMSTSITLDTPVAELHSHIARLGPTSSRRLALALAAAEHKKADDITADDLLHYLPMRYEDRSEEHTSELQSQSNLVCRLLLEKQ